jgi:hypothetical protein
LASSSSKGAADVVFFTLAALRIHLALRSLPQQSSSLSFAAKSNRMFLDRLI